jgi:tetratricopeptide (TPR) repeat protein
VTNEKIISLLEQPNQLEHITYEELKTLVLAYPYAHNLRVLLASKSKAIGHPDLERNLAMAATYTLDRKRLFQIMTAHIIAPVKIEQQEQMLELKPIAQVKEALATYVPVERAASSEPVKQAEIAIPVAAATIITASRAETMHIDEEDEMITELPQAEAKPTEPVSATEIAEVFPRRAKDSSTFFAQWAQQFILPTLEKQKAAGAFEVTETRIEKEVIPEPTPRVSIVTAPAAQMAQPTEIPAETPVNARVLAEKSLLEDTSLASETLAKLYARQGLHQKAIEMYQRLILANPEKTTFFAAQIEKLR